MTRGKSGRRAGEILNDAAGAPDVRCAEAARGPVVVAGLRRDIGAGSLLELEHLVAANPVGRIDALTRGTEYHHVAGIEDEELPVVVRHLEVAGRDVGAGGSIRRLHVDPPVVPYGVVADVVEQVFGHRDDRARTQVRPDGVAGQGEGLDRTAVVAPDQVPAAHVEVVDRHHQLEPVAAVPRDRSPEGVRVAATEEAGGRHSVVLVQDDRCRARIDAEVDILVARQPRTRIAGGLAVEHRVAGLGPVAEEAVLARTVVRGVVAAVGHLVARVRGAAHRVVAVHQRPRLAVERHVAGLREPSQNRAIVTEAVVRDVVTGVGACVARVDGAADAVVAGFGDTGLAVQQRIAQLHPVAEHPVLAGSVIGQDSQASRTSLQASKVQPTPSSQTTAVPGAHTSTSQVSTPLQ